MNYLFVHQHFPGQYQHLAGYLARVPGNRVVFISHDNVNRIEGVERVVYEPFRKPTPGIHHYLGDLESAVVYGQSVFQAAMGLKNSGFRPDIIIGHNGWGEILFLKDIWPDVPLLGYFEFFYRLRGADLGFDPDAPVSVDDGPRIALKNAVNLLGIEASDWGQTPTWWQWSLYPETAKTKISVIHEGIDTDVVRPDPEAWLTVADTRLTVRDEVITYVSRNLEPYRGFSVFMRALPEILRRRPRAHVLIIGGDDVSYGPPSPDGRSFRTIMMEEVGGGIDLARVHFLGKLPYELYLTALKISSAHVYLTFPFVLSWSFVEAMSAGCALIASNTRPVAELIRDGENGLLVDFFDIRAIADRIDEVLDQPDRTREMRERARRDAVENYDLRTVTLPRHLALIDDLIAGRKPLIGSPPP